MDSTMETLRFQDCLVAQSSSPSEACNGLVVAVLAQHRTFVFPSLQDNVCAWSRLISLNWSTSVA